MNIHFLHFFHIFFELVNLHEDFPLNITITLMFILAYKFIVLSLLFTYYSKKLDAFKYIKH
jgi:hypothetical protein